MFNWFKKKNKFPELALYKFEYHRELQPDKLLFETLQYSWRQAVNVLICHEHENSIYIDNVDIKVIK